MPSLSDPTPMAARAGVHGREFAVVAHALSRITADIDAQAIKALALVTASRPEALMPQALHCAPCKPMTWW
ncbi:MAG: hypothetical protein KatS3mg122_0880 [Caldimonas sp.]|nr:MAG: hypothetical protein KatS3mg122_0880 [Caldimonas sp.]